MQPSRMALLVLGVALGLASAAWAWGTDPGTALGLPQDVTAAMQRIDAERIRAHVRYLSDDLLEGRGTGTRGGDIAAKYIAAQFALDGLTPAGDDGGYLQKIEFTGVHTEPETTLSLQPEHGAALDLKLGDDFVTNNQTQTDTVDIDAPLVFVGYGIEAPEYRWNDFKGVDVSGKVLLVIVNEPPSKDPKFFNGEAMTYYGRWTYKFEEAARKGAVGVLIIHRTDLASYGWAVVRSSWSNEQVYLSNDKDPKLKAASWIQLEAARALFSASGLNLDEMIANAGVRGFKPRALPVRVKAHIVSKVRKFESSNVLGLLPGTDAGPPQQALVYSAHYDHLGIDPAMSGDNIYNGAVDNGTGVGMLLEMAHVFAAAPRPPHPVLFAAVTAEEKGLLGSNYLGKHLPIPAARIALGLNFDAIPPIGYPESVNVTGAERTSFYPTVEKTARAFGFDIQPDAEPGAGHYYRSDHFSLARAGVPAFSINTGVKFAGHPPEWGKAQRDEYTAKHYHNPSDEYLPSMDFSTNAALDKFGFALGWQALLAKGTVNWLPGDEFEGPRLKGVKTE
ncbi:MAG TPA: M28 family peptidase [Steroidobacteraceae bacterium]|nr:M28 family peptidase [Steroidobacteraceae bacterium]